MSYRDILAQAKSRGKERLAGRDESFQLFSNSTEGQFRHITGMVTMASRELVVVLDWFSELERLVPAN